MCNSLNSTCDYHAHKTYILVFDILRWIQAFFIVFGNSLVVASGIKYKRMRRSSYYFLYSLSCSDYIVAITNITLFVNRTYFQHEKYFQIWLVLLHMNIFLNILQSTLNLFHFTLMSMERFLFVTAPFFAKTYLTKRTVICLLITAWLMGIILVVTSTQLGYVGDKNIPLWSNEWTVYLNEEAFFAFSLIFVGLSLLTFVLYSTVAYKLVIKPKLRRNKTGTVQSSITSTTAEQRQRKITRVMALVMGTYYLLYLPAFVESQIAYDEYVKEHVEYAVFYLWFSNAMANPLIYYSTNKDFHVAFKCLLKRKQELDFEKELTQQSVSVIN